MPLIPAFGRQSQGDLFESRPACSIECVLEQPDTHRETLSSQIEVVQGSVI